MSQRVISSFAWGVVDSKVKEPEIFSLHNDNYMGWDASDVNGEPKSCSNSSDKSF